MAKCRLDQGAEKSMSQLLQRSYYQASAPEFMAREDEAILGELVASHTFDTDVLQRGAWQHQIRAIKRILPSLPSTDILFEFAIPRMGKRADVVLLTGGIVFVLEYKAGEASYPRHAIEQALDYATDLKNFHEGSHDRKIVPVLVSTKAQSVSINDEWFDDDVSHVQCTNDDSLPEVIEYFVSNHGSGYLDHASWIASTYKPTPTICEAAQALYAGHDVSDISRSDAGAINLSKTAECISQIIGRSKSSNRKSICFVTGVPGSGKTLAGLNIANQRLNSHKDEHAVFLSGNGPLVTVLQEALARDKVRRYKDDPAKAKMSKKVALTEALAFIQNIHHFRDENLRTEKPPAEQVVVFDEAQRAWTKKQASRFMREKRGLESFDQSEPEFLLSVMDRHTDWCTVICVIGGGQEINTGEAGIGAWFDALRGSFNHWDIFVSEGLSGSEHFGSEALEDHMGGLNASNEPDLHLDTAVRSFRAEKVSNFVHNLIEGESAAASSLMASLNEYPIVLTRDVGSARKWLRSKARGTERYGLLASSNAQRLRAIGPDVRVKIDPVTWFLNDSMDVRSSYYLEDIATEFDIQGLELDWVGMCWDANLRRGINEWELFRFRGSKWENVNDLAKRSYLINSYRVLLTRARQGMVICVPLGDPNDQTRLPEFYDPTYDYLRECGVRVID
jgi:hypothetical protein